MKTILTKTIMVILLSSIYIGLLHAQEYDRMNIKPFDYDVVAFPIENSSDYRVDVFAWIRNNQLQFIKDDSVFTAQYQVNLDIFRKKDTDLTKDTSFLTKDSTFEVVEHDFNKTISRNAYHLVYFRFNLPPNTYVFKTRLYDSNSDWDVFQEVKKDLIAMDPNKIFISDILYLKENNLEGDITQLIIPPARIPIQDQIYIYAGIMTGKNAREFDLDASLITENNRKIPLLSKHFSSESTLKAVLIDLPREDMVRGPNKLLLVLTSGKQKSETEKMMTFTGGTGEVAGRSIKQMVEELRYIASKDEWNKIDKAQGQEQERLFQEFWNKRDPSSDPNRNPLEAEYYKRIQFANQNFSVQNRPGWETDRGHVYAIYGKPDSIEKTDDSYGMGSYEVWNYTELNKKFVFYDEHGFGDYRLVSGFI